MSKIVLGLVFMVFIPFGAVSFAWNIRKRILNENVPKPPQLQLGLVLLFYLVAYFQIIPGLSGGFISTPVWALITMLLVGLFSMRMVMYSLRNSKDLSLYHLWLYRMAFGYMIVVPILVVLSIWLIKVM